MIMTPWIFVDSGFRSGTENMQLDDWLARYWFSETRQPVFRLYRWSPYTLSLGYHQHYGDVDIGKLNDAGFDLVRRPTGGRAVFHAEEITYSIVMDATGKRVDEVYEIISRVLASALQAAGYEVEFAAGNQNFSDFYRKKHSVSCFTASSDYEIQIAGRKLVGSAQRRYARPDGGVTALQHGSILTGPSHQQLVDFLTIDDSHRQKLKKIIRQSSIDLSELSTKPVEYDLLKKHLKDSAMKHLAGGYFDDFDHESFTAKMNENVYNPE